MNIDIFQDSQCKSEAQIKHFLAVKAIMFESVWKYIPADWPYISSLLIQIACDSSDERKIQNMF